METDGLGISNQEPGASDVESILETRAAEARQDARGAFGKR